MSKGQDVKLMYALVGAPPEMDAAVEAIGFERISFVRPGLYTKKNPRRWDQETAEKNFKKIDAVCNGAKWIVLDLEGPARFIIREWPSEDLSRDDLDWAANKNFIPSWAWFRKHWPAKLSEWNLNKAQYAGQYPTAERMVAQYLDAIDISMFARFKPDWRERNQRALNHALDLSQKYGKPLITSLRSRYSIHQPDGKIEYAPLPHEDVHDSVNMAVSSGVDIAWAWSFVHAILGTSNPNPRYLLTEVLRGDENPLYSLNAQELLVISQMRLREGETAA